MSDSTVSVIPIMIGSMFVCGLAGGYANYWYSKSQFVNSDSLSSAVDFKSSIAFSLIAAAMTPLFLGIIQSQVILELFEPKDVQMNLMFFAGYCLIAAVGARAFIVNLSNKIVSDLNVLQEKVDETIDAVENGPSEDEIDDSFAQAGADLAQGLDASEAEHLRAMGQKPNTRRSLSGLRADLAAPYDTAKTSDLKGELLKLEAKQLLSVRASQKDGAARYRLTPLGLATLHNI